MKSNKPNSSYKQWVHLMCTVPLLRKYRYENMQMTNVAHGNISFALLSLKTPPRSDPTLNKRDGNFYKCGILCLHSRTNETVIKFSWKNTILVYLLKIEWTFEYFRNEYEAFWLNSLQYHTKFKFNGNTHETKLKAKSSIENWFKMELHRW